MSLLQLCFTADAKFLISFRTIAISIVTWCRLYIFSVLLFSFNLAQHCLFFLLLIGSSSEDVRRPLIGSETVIFFEECHETQISITNSFNRTLSPKIWASYCSAEYCPSRRMQKAHFRSTCIRKYSIVWFWVGVKYCSMGAFLNPLYFSAVRRSAVMSY